MLLTTSAASGAGDQVVACFDLAIASIGVSPHCRLEVFVVSKANPRAPRLRSVMRVDALIEGKANPYRERNPLASPARFGHAAIPRL
jgi:hypothetical protein